MSVLFNWLVEKFNSFDIQNLWETGDGTVGLSLKIRLSWFLFCFICEMKDYALLLFSFWSAGMMVSTAVFALAPRQFPVPTTVYSWYVIYLFCQSGIQHYLMLYAINSSAVTDVVHRYTVIVNWSIMTYQATQANECKFPKSLTNWEWSNKWSDDSKSPFAHKASIHLSLTFRYFRPYIHMASND